MIHIFNRLELTTLFELDRVEEIRNVLALNNIEHQVRVIDRSSPSIFSMGTRERSGVLFQNLEHNWRYTIYVKRRDFSKAQDCTGISYLQ